MKMKLNLLIFSIILLASMTELLGVGTQAPSRIFDDGPYVTLTEDSVNYLWIEEGKVETMDTPRGSSYCFERPNLPKLALGSIEIKEDNTAGVIKTAEPIFAISDIHGQYDLFVQLLKSNRIVNDQLEWIFEKGHLVVVGDVMGRGDKVTECHWLLLKLENEAKGAGGNVHYLLGNHELMVMNGDLGYANRKYLMTGGLSRVPYDQLYGRHQLFGQWLSGKNVLLKINNTLFVHGGISQQALDFRLSLKEINKLFKDKIYYKPQKDIEKDQMVAELYYDEGPLWYRGYAYPYTFNPEKIDLVKSRYEVDHIVVGHTTLNEIKGLHDNSVVLIDSGIKWGEKGEALVIERQKMNVVNEKGEKHSLISEEKKSYKKKSLFDHVYGQEEVMVVISEDFSTLEKALKKEEVTQGTMDLFVNKEQLTFSAGYELGGKTRRTICSNPPIKVNLKKPELENFNFKKDLDKIKFVFQCDATGQMQESIRQEKLIYDLYGTITSFGHRAQIAKVRVGKNKKFYEALILEDDDDVAHRNEAIKINSAAIAVQIVNREEYVRMCLFQYMIANTDWSARLGHNTEIFQVEADKSFVIVPYDFDYAGIINNDYAVVSEKLPIQRVTDRYFMDKSITPEELASGVNYFINMESKLYEVCDSAGYLSEGARKRMKKFIEGFYNIIKDEKKLLKVIDKK